jgi:uncharacterized protein YceK
MQIRKLLICLCISSIMAGCATIDARFDKKSGNRLGTPFAATRISPSKPHGSKPAEVLLLLFPINLIVAPFFLVGYGIDFAVALTTDIVLLPIDLTVMATSTRSSPEEEPQSPKPPTK